MMMKWSSKSLEVWRVSKGVQTKVGAQLKPTSESASDPRGVRTNRDIHDAYKLGLGRSRYPWKDKEKTYSLAPISRPIESYGLFFSP